MSELEFISYLNQLNDRLLQYTTSHSSTGEVLTSRSITSNTSKKASNNQVPYSKYQLQVYQLRSLIRPASLEFISLPNSNSISTPSGSFIKSWFKQLQSHCSPTNLTSLLRRTPTPSTTDIKNCTSLVSYLHPLSVDDAQMIKFNSVIKGRIVGITLRYIETTDPESEPSINYEISTFPFIPDSPEKFRVWLEESVTTSTFNGGEEDVPYLPQFLVTLLS